jgi:hypothetical protein
MKNRRCGLLMVCAVVVAAAQAGLAAPVLWPSNGHSYEVVVVTETDTDGKLIPISWLDAQAAAVAMGGYLATLTSAEENQFVFELIPLEAWTHPAEWAEGPWLGGSDAASEGNWQWVTGEPWDYTSWLGGQPDNWNDIENYLCFWGNWSDETPPTAEPTWNDATDPQSSIYSYVVEYDELVEADTEPPTISSVTASPSVLWPANHKMVPVTVTIVASDDTGVVSSRIISVTSSEPDNGLGDGDTAGDIQITGDLSLLLRAERSGKGNGRTYTITVECQDEAGNASTGTTTVTVPRDQGKK